MIKLISTRHFALVASSVALVALQSSAAYAAPAFVSHVGNNASKTSGASLVVDTADAGVAVGNTVIITFAMDPVSGTVSCSDAKGNTYAVDLEVTNKNGGATTFDDGVRTVICSAPITTALVSGDDITVTHPTATARAMSVNEFSGLLSTGRLDQTESDTDDSDDNPSSGNTDTTTQASELLIGAIGYEGEDTDDPTAGDDYTALTIGSTGNASSASGNMTIFPEYRIVNAIDEYSADADLDNDRDWAAGIATYKASTCGDGMTSGGESCDDGNTAAGDCCSATCTFESAATVCRAATGDCDAEETCTGSSGTCPADADEPAGTACGDPTDTTCDAADTCDGNGACEENIEPSTTVCREATDDCDLEETCDGAGACATDELAEAGAACGDSSDTTCDDPDTCDGSGACEPNFASSATLCRSAVGECDVAETCDGAGACEADDFADAGTACGDFGTECTNQDTCDGGGTCDDNGFVSAGTACGDPTDSVCNDPDTCSGGGVCVENYEPDTTECRPSAGECDAAESCDGSGSCPTDGFESAGTACGDSTDSVCDDPDTCNASGECVENNAPGTTECRPSTGECDVAETCDGSGACPVDVFVGAGTACGDSTDSICDDPDTCDGGGACVENHALATVECRPDTGDCDDQEYCDGNGACPADAFVAAGTPCGDSSDTVCDDPNTCDGSGACAENPAAVTVECRPDAGDCDVEEYCNGSGACPADGFEAGGTACGDPGDTVCDNPDTCDTVGTCLENHESATFECRPDAGDCDVEEYCDANGACPADGFAPAGTTCGDPADTDCDHPDTCDGDGACEANYVAAAASCGDPTDTDCTNPDSCDGDGACLPNHETPGLACGGEATDCTSAGSCSTEGTCSGSTFAAAGTACGSADDTDCDDPDTCDGAGACEPNTELAGTGCGDGSDGDCDNPDTCDGIGSCATNLEPATYECRAAVDVCDTAELCDGAGTCPPNGFATAGTACGSATDTDCDDPDTCNGSGVCATNLVSAGTLCRGAIGDCDVSEVCDGLGVCPGDAVADTSVECRAADGACDVAENCDGGTKDCPIDGVAAGGTVCGEVDGECDSAGTCDGSTKVCPADIDDADGDGLCDDADPCPDDALNDADADGICVGASFNAPSTGGDDNCPSDANPDQGDADADDVGDLCDYICFAPALDATLVLSGAMTTSAAFTGGADNDPVLDSASTQLLYANSTSNAGGINGDNATYGVSLPVAGPWFAFGRFYYPGSVGSNDANSFFLRINTGATQKFGNNKDFFQTWHWDGNGNTENGAPDALALGNLAAGANTVTIYKREVVPVQPRLDLVCLSPRSIAPSDAEACANTPEGTCGGSTTTVSITTTTTSTTTSTLPEAEIVCLRAGSDPSLDLRAQMTTGTAFTGGADADAALDNLTAPLLFSGGTNNQLNSPLNGHRAIYSVEIPTGTDWFLWGRFYYPGAPGSNDANSFFAQLNGRTSRKFGNNKDFFRAWHWGGNGAQETGTPSGIALGNVNAGTHTLTIRKREVSPVAPRLDVICLSTDGVNAPTDAEACAALGGCP